MSNTEYQGVQYLTTKEAAEILRVTADTMRRWRYEKTGPKFYRIKTKVRYKPSDLEKFVEQDS